MDDNDLTQSIKTNKEKYITQKYRKKDLINRIKKLSNFNNEAKKLLKWINTLSVNSIYDYCLSVIEEIETYENRR